MKISFKNFANVILSGFASYSYTFSAYTNLIVGYPFILNLSAVSTSLSQSISLNIIFIPLNDSPTSSLNAFHSGSAFFDRGHQSV